MMNFQDILSAAAFETMIRGPFVWGAFIICGLGIAIQSRRLIHMTRKRQIPQTVFQQTPLPATFADRFRNMLIFLRVSILGNTPCMAVISFIFHVCLLATPFLVMGHNVLLDTAFGFSFVSLSETATDTLTLVVIFCCGFFLVRRLFVRRVRVISGPSDFILLIAAAAPFMTGFLAYHHFFNYRIMINLHILSAEIVLVMIPFSRFFHMIFFFVNRLLIIGQHSRKSADRVWCFDGPGGC